MALIESAFVLSTPVGPRRCRLFLVVFLVRMWRLNACERLMLPLPRTRKRFFAPLLIFGMTSLSLFAAHGGALRRRGFLRLLRRRRLTGLGLVRVMLGYCALLRGQQHHHLPAFQLRKLFNDAVRLEISTDALEQANAEFLVGHLAAAEPQRHFRLVAFAQEPDQVPELDLVIALVGAGSELHFLDLDLLELELGLVSALRLTVLELAEVHDSAYRGLGKRGDLYEIELRCFRTLQSVRNRYDANLLTVLTNQANLGGGDLAVDSLRTFLGYWALLLFMKDRPCFPLLVSLARPSGAMPPQPGDERQRLPGAWPPDPRQCGYARPPFAPASPCRPGSAGTAASAGYVLEFYKLFSRCANRLRPENPLSEASPRPPRRKLIGDR